MRAACCAEPGVPLLRTAVLLAARHYEGVLEGFDRSYREGGASSLLALLGFRDRRVSIAHARQQAELLLPDAEAAAVCIGYARGGASLINLWIPPRERIGWLEAGIRAARQLADSHAESRLLTQLGICFAALGESSRAEDTYRSALSLCGEHDPGAECSALGNLGNLFLTTGRPREAIEPLTRVIEVAQALERPAWEADAYNGLGVAYRDGGDLDRAAEYHQQALALHRKIGNLRGEGGVLINLGLIHRKKGDTGQAIDSYRQALPVVRAIHDERAEGDVLWNMSLALDHAGETEAAIDCAEGALSIRERLDDPRAIKVRRRLEAWRDSSRSAVEQKKQDRGK
jgi:tetratricopeptide (TPR) repeat protein